MPSFSVLSHSGICGRYSAISAAVTCGESRRHASQCCDTSSVIFTSSRFQIGNRLRVLADFLCHRTDREPYSSQPGVMPTHVSWLNPIELWFGIVRRRVFRYGPSALQTHPVALPSASRPRVYEGSVLVPGQMRD